MKRTQLSALILSLISALFVGCGLPKGFYVTVTRPAEVNLKNFDKIAVGEIKGSGSGAVLAIPDLGMVATGGTTKDEGSRLFSEELMEALFESERFDVLDHESLKTALSQNNLVLSSLTDGGNQEEIKKIFGNIALISGNISEYEYDEDVTQKDVERKDKETGKVTTTTTYTRKGTANVSVRLRVVDLRTSKILANKKFTESRTKKKSKKNSRPSSIDRKLLLAACREEIIDSVMRMIVPYTERVYVAFESAEEMPELASGFSMAMVGNWDAAIDIFQKATATYSASPLVHKAYYNLGLSYMYTDQFDQAQTALEKAYTGKPNARKYLNAINELRDRIEDTRRLEEQRWVNPDAEESDSEPMQEQGQPDAEEGE